MEMKAKFKITRQDFKDLAIYFAQNPGEQSVDIDLNIGDTEGAQQECDCYRDEIACSCGGSYGAKIPVETEEEKWAREAKEFLRESGIDY